MAVDTVFSLNETQFQQVLAALNAQQGWWPVVSVFVSALLAMIVGIIVGIFLDKLRRRKEKENATRGKQEHEIQLINSVISRIVFNIERLLHIASQNIIPHYKDSHIVYAKVQDARENNDRLDKIMRSLYKYPALFMTCPKMCLIQCDFSSELPFIIERDPELVKHSGWLIAGAFEIEDATAWRNRNIEGATNVANFREGAHNLYSFQSAVQMQASIANTECVVSSQLFEVLIRLGRGLKKINDSYIIPAKKSKFTPPTTLSEIMTELKKISDKIPLPS